MPLRSFSAHCAYLGFPLRNIRWSWSAVSTDGARLLFTIWEDELINGRYVLYPTTERRPRQIDEEANKRLGAREVERLARLAIEQPTVQCFGIVCRAKDPTARVRQRKSYLEDILVPLVVREEEGTFVAYGKERVSTSHITSAAR